MLETVRGMPRQTSVTRRVRSEKEATILGKRRCQGRLYRLDVNVFTELIKTRGQSSRLPRLLRLRSVLRSDHMGTRRVANGAAHRLFGVFTTAD